jgi:signal transduction histidine kinase
MDTVDALTRRRYVRLAGGVYLLLILLFMTGIVIHNHLIGDGGFAEAARSVSAQATLYRFGLWLQLLSSAGTVVLAYALYVVLRPVDALLAQQALLWRFAEAVVGAGATVIAFGRPALYVASAQGAALSPEQGTAVVAALRAMHAGGFAAGILFFSVGSTLFFLLFRRTDWLPRWLSGLGVFASVLTAFVATGLLIAPDAHWVEVGWLPIFVAEILTGLWLLAARGDAGAQPAAAPVAPVRAVSNKRRYATRFAVALIGGVPFALLISIQSPVPLSIWFVRVWFVSFAAVLAYSLCERWPARLPPWQARWVYTLLGVVAVIPLAAYAGYWVTTGEFAFWQNQSKRLEGFLSLTFAGVLFAPWIALAAMVRTREALAHEQALAFALERSQLERQALDARLRLLQAQVQPHFLLNTLANVRALVGAGSPQAPAVLDSLIAYLRAAVPKLDAPAATVGDELKLVRAYLELMQLRMPDRLRYSIDAEPAALAVACPPLTLLTLVENAVRHGIDPGERGGAIEVAARVRDGRCTLRVVDTGVGLSPGGGSAGTGLANLRERLQLTYGDGAALRLTEIAPNGVAAEVEFPVQPPPR